MCFILRLFGCCIESDNKQNEYSIKQLPPKSTLNEDKRVNPAILQASTVSGLNTIDLTQVYYIPNKRFRTDNDVISFYGYQIDWQQILGKGKYGIVFKAIHTSGQIVVAVKVMAIDNKKESMFKDAKNELFIMEKTSHPHIIKVYTHFIIKDKTNKTNNVFIFMRFAENKSLSDYIRTKKLNFDEPSAKRLFAQIVSAIDYMHGLGIAHRDLKLSNVLLDSDMNAMVADFGLSRVLYTLSEKKTIMCYTKVGTTEYMAPEILIMETTKMPYDPFAADIWALGVILYGMINRCYPFGNEPKTMIRLHIKFEETNPNICRYYKASPDLDDIIKKIFRYEKKDRIKMSALVNHNWIKDEIKLINEKIESQNKS